MLPCGGRNSRPRTPKIWKPFLSFQSSEKICLKIDLSKAFDNLNWRFIEWALVTLNFHPTMIKWIMRSVCRSEFFVLLNGASCSFFNSKRGLRQGCPLSLSIFFVYDEIFLPSRMCNKWPNPNAFLQGNAVHLKPSFYWWCDDFYGCFPFCTW